ncbi:nucleotidyltransferase domain-containing protein [Caulobacter sp. KR2-114]|uniref:nucleotidyltransferase domain-containing protein n=1 Tax=Caulobacter sp. KR2-114 TaxID=3400912 RepID=UPI003C06A22E
MGAATESQRALLARLIEVLGEDERIESAWLSGSFGKGAGDAWSDVDVTAVVDEEDLPHCIREYGGAKTPVGDTVLIQTVHGRVVSAVRGDWERYDIVFVTPQEFRSQDRTKLRPLTLESLDLAAAPSPAEPRPYQPSVDALEGAIREFLRVMGLLPVAIGREEWLVGVEGVGLLRKALIEMMFEANGIGRGQRGGAKAVNAYLTPAQRAAVEAAPLGGPSREAMIAANQALAGLFLPLARETLAKAGGTWPQALEDATRAHLKRVLDLEF